MLYSFQLLSNETLNYNNAEMSGHSKWHKIKNQKAANDPKRGKEFTRLSQLIRSAAREGGADPNANPSLRKAIEDAKAANVPKENIERAINRGAGIGMEGRLEAVSLEGYGPGGVAILIQGETDNKNRTVAEIRHVFKDFEGSLGEPGSAAYVFGSNPESPVYKTPVSDPDLKGKLIALIDSLEEHPDIELVYHNLEE